MRDNLQEYYANKELNLLKTTIFESVCSIKEIPVITEKIPYSDLPSGIPLSMREFYSAFAPVEIRLQSLNIEFLPYAQVFAFLAKSPSPQLIPLAVYNGNQPIYIDKYPDGSWDERVQLEIGNKKVQILGEDVFDFIAHLADRLINQ